ncbi:MAG: phage tail assembly chaperone [Rhodobiaceae bacterium]|nr:phage tail assembly chaperone [Rhodobiaceae bacterium]
MRWTPGDFWGASLCELEGAVSACVPAADATMSKGGFSGLMARFPDKQTGTQPNGI